MTGKTYRVGDRVEYVGGSNYLRDYHGVVPGGKGTVSRDPDGEPGEPPSGMLVQWDSNGCEVRVSFSEVKKVGVTELNEGVPGKVIYTANLEGVTDVNPSHYDFPGGAQVIDITKHLDFLAGNVVKYVCRAGRKGDKVTDLLKAKQYLEWLIERESGE